MRNNLLQSAEEAMEWDGINFYVVTMTPQLAQELLRGNVKNRGLRDAISNNYLTDMRSGAWLFTGTRSESPPTGLFSTDSTVSPLLPRCQTTGPLQCS